MTVTNDKKYVITAWLSSGDIRIHSVSTKKEVHTFKRAHSCNHKEFYGAKSYDTGRITSIGVSPDDRWLVSADATGQAKVWDLQNLKEIYSKEKHQAGNFCDLCCDFTSF